MLNEKIGTIQLACRRETVPLWLIWDQLGCALVLLSGNESVFNQMQANECDPMSDPA